MMILLLACSGGDDALDSALCADEAWFYYDADGDGYGNVDQPTMACSAPAGYRVDYGDCDDLDPATHPGAAETCNGRDDDCNTLADDDATDAATWYPDDDADSYGTASGSTQACEQPTGFVDNDDGIDNDGAGEVDEPGSEGEASFFLDADGDGAGDASLSVTSCAAPEGYVETSDDCDDYDASTYPGAPEADCTDPVDHNCDGSVGYADADLDAYPACADCDDADASQFPGATEVCNGEDDDCNGDDDDDAADASTWYADADADGFGGSSGELACEQPPGAVADNTDCDDGDAGVAPGAAETCNGDDDDCDGQVDNDAIDGTSSWTDADGDGYGDPASEVIDCDGSGVGVGNGDDCDDTEVWTFPGAPETCDGTDENCDGQVDESGAVGESTWYADHDSDGFGEVATTSLGCDAPAGYVADGTDCDDYDAGTNPGANETCDGEDDDCDGEVDEDEASDAPTWYLDLDADGYGGLTGSLVACAAPSGYAATGDDCDDNDAFAYPGAEELCDGKATDCADSGWTTDAGIVSFFSDADEAWTDWTDLFATGTVASPVAIDVTEDGQLNVCPGTWYVSVTVDDYLVASVVGPEGAASTVLDGGGSSRVMQTGGGGTVALEGITLRDGYANYGGGLYASSYYSTLTVTDCIFSGNEAYSDGGAAFLSNQSETYTFTRVVFENNNAGSRGGGICIGCTGGGYSILNLVDSEFTGNTAPYGGGTYTLYDVDVVASGV